MLKKTDLAKQFELVVKQEIKNYQDSLNFVLQSIREIRESIEKSRIEYLENYASIKGKHDSLLIELNGVKESLASLNQRFESSLSDQRKLNERNYLEIRDISSHLISSNSAKNNFESKISDLNYQIDKIIKNEEKNNKIVNDNLDGLLKRFREQILKMKNEILEAPTEASFVKKELEEKMARHKVDVAGIMRELSIYKKENYITQKKIENIYTLIERLKKPEVNQ